MVDCKKPNDLNGMSVAEMVVTAETLLVDNKKTRGIPILALVIDELKSLTNIVHSGDPCSACSFLDKDDRFFWCTERGFSPLVPIGGCKDFDMKKPEDT